jgi:hypothetical protein
MRITMAYADQGRSGRVSAEYAPGVDPKRDDSSPGPLMQRMSKIRDATSKNSGTEDRVRRFLTRSEEKLRF